MEIREYGKKTNPLVVAVHGGPGMDDSYLMPALEPLTASCRIITYRQTKASMPELVDQLQTVIDQAKSKHGLFLLGHSFGATVVIEYLRRNNRSSVNGVVLTSWVFDSSYLQHMMKANEGFVFPNPDLALSVSERYRQLSLGCAPIYFTPKNQDLAIKILSRIDYCGESWMAISSQYLEDFDLKSVIRSLREPVLSLVGAKDQCTPPIYVQAGADLMPVCEHYSVEEAGHFPFIENQGSFCERVIDFVINNGGDKRYEIKD